MKVKSKAHVEASIVEAYLVEEISLFSSLYFESRVLCKRNRPHRNGDLSMNDTRIQQSIFNYPGRASGASKKRWLSGLERHIIDTYILINCEVVRHSTMNRSFLNELYEKYHPKDPIIEELVATQFKDWFKRRVKTDLNYTDNSFLKLHYWGLTAEIFLPPGLSLNYRLQFKVYSRSDWLKTGTDQSGKARFRTNPLQFMIILGHPDH
ncbi:UNVERIFIED_CONTAM: hypothetical protein Sradi_5851200 [Sesamum radiatum]|uniref:DUF4218 domain-containing protein n=1 Tax=Sesamum radiatum TaxID=300843 RepID=A0AAW2KQ47_SESRA